MDVKESVVDDNEGGAENCQMLSISSEGSDLLDSDSDDDESRQREELVRLEAELSGNPCNYDAHVQYITLSRKMCEVEKLRQAREAMNVLFPLTPEMWQEWAKDEKALTAGHQILLTVEKIYERGVFEYLSVRLWCDYLNFTLENDPLVRELSLEGISKVRDLFERALTAAGLHVSEGNKIWDAYREFEEGILRAIENSNPKEIDLQVQRIRSIFHRQLSIPSLNLRLVLHAYKAWEVDQGAALDAESSDTHGLLSHVASAYQKAIEMYDARLQHEEQIQKHSSDTEKFETFMKYLEFEKSANDPVRVQVLYERAIACFPVSSDLWLGYTLYIDKTFKVGSVLRNVYSRAVKSCPWVGGLWIRYLLSLERGLATEKEIVLVFEKAIQSPLSTHEEYLELFLTRIDGLRRRIVSGCEANGVLDYSLIRGTFQYAADYLSSQLKNSDSLLWLYSYWARLELSLGKDLAAARGVWESFLKISGSILEAWQGYIAMEIELGNTNEARSIYRKCYTRRFAGTGSEDICNSWLRFEREFGTLEEYDHAMQKVTPRLEELTLYRMQAESKRLAKTNQGKNNLQNEGGKKRKGDSYNTTHEQFPVKWLKKAAETQGEQGGRDHNEAPTVIGTEEDNPKSENANGTSQLQKNPYTDKCTVFISNLDRQANNEDLRKFFSDIGGIVGVRILYDRISGKSRGLAYMDFLDDEHLAAAVAKNKQKLLGKKLSIARSAPKKGKKVEPVPHHSSSDAKPTELDESARSKQDVSMMEQRGKKNTFAVPRNVKPLGWTARSTTFVGGGDEKPKSNEEFRKMFIKN